MRVLAVSNFFPPHDVGGAELSAFNTCLGLLERGIEVSALMVHARLRRRANLHHRVRGVSVRERTFMSLPLGSYSQVFDPRVYWAVVSEIRRVQPDLVHVHNISGATLAPFVACRRLGVPVVLTLHDHWLLCPNNTLYRGNGVSCDPAQDPDGCDQCFRHYDFWADIPRRRQVFSQLVESVGCFVSPSQGTVDRHVAAGYDRRRFRVIPYGIHPEAYQSLSDPALRGYVCQSAYTPTLLYAGALVEMKGVRTIVEAVPLFSRYVRTQFLVAGRGDAISVSSLRSLDPRVVKLLGRVPFQEMRHLYVSADLAVVPSICYDNSPMVIYESLLSGTPVLGADIGGIPELVRDGETGYVFPADDAGALAERVILHFSRSALRRRRMRQRAFEYAHGHLTMDRHLDALLDVYAEVLGRPLPEGRDTRTEESPT
jgi:glycosyltransferase involved in cell wall biosynthesis